MFGRILILIAITGLMLGTNPSLMAQQGVAASAVGAASGAAAGAAPVPTTLWRFLGIPQGFQRVRDAVTNRRGNRPRLERRPPVKRIADPANLESEFPAIKKAAEVKQAEDMKLQKIKAIKYLATIGCGCYDKDGEITEALIAATDDCTPDVREAALEAIEDAAGGECCRKCGSTSCCNEDVNKRLSEMAYERDDTGCPIEPNAEIRRLAARVLKRCCPGGPPSGPIEEEIEEDSEELIPAPEPEEPPISESGEGEDDSLGEESGADDFEMEEEPVDPEDNEGEDPYQDDPDESFSDLGNDAPELTLMEPDRLQPEPMQPGQGEGLHFRFDDASSMPSPDSLPMPELQPVNQLQPVHRIESTMPVVNPKSAAKQSAPNTPVRNTPAVKPSVVVEPLVAEASTRAIPAVPTDHATRAPKLKEPASVSSTSRLIRRNQSASILKVQPVVVAQQVPVEAVKRPSRSSLQRTVVKEVVSEKLATERIEPVKITPARIEPDKISHQTIAPQKIADAKIAPASIAQSRLDPRESIMIQADQVVTNNAAQVVQVSVEGNAQEIVFDVSREPSPQAEAPSVKPTPTAVRSAGNHRVVARVVSVNLNSGHVILQGANVQTLHRKMEGELYRRSVRGFAKITGITVVRVEDGNVRVRVADRKRIRQIQMGDQAVFH